MGVRSKAFWFSITFAASVTSATAQETVRVGVIVSKTGLLSAHGIEAEQAINLAIAASKVKMEVILLDDESNPAKAASEARRLLAEDKVHVIVGPTATASSAALVSVLKDSRNTALISLSAAPTRADDKPEYFFRIGVTEGHLMVFAKDFMQRNLSAKEIAVVAAPQMFAPGASAEVAFSEFRTVPLPFPTDLRVWDTIQLKEAKATYLSLQSIQQPGEVLRVIRRATPAPIVVASLVGLSPFIDQEYSNSFVVTMRDDVYPAGEMFREDFASANGGRLPVSGYGARAYSAMQVIEKAAISANFRAGASGASETLAKAISGGSFETILGKLILRPREGCSPLPLGIYKLDRSRAIEASVTGNPCNCTDSGCCDSCCTDKQVSCTKSNSCS